MIEFQLSKYLFFFYQSTDFPGIFFKISGKIRKFVNAALK